MSIYERLGVSPLINAVGTQTWLGGTIMCPEQWIALQWDWNRSCRHRAGPW